MDLRQLRYFVAVAEGCHFGRAAEQLHIAQPALSQTIRQLEAELGTALFVRTTRHVSLTPAGVFLLAEARRTLGSVEDTVRGVQQFAAGHVGLLRLALTGTSAFTQFPRMARVLRRALPEVALEIHADLLTPAQCDGLRAGTFDLGVLRPPVVGEGLALSTLEVEPLVLAMPADHTLAEGDRLDLGDLRTEPFLLYAARDSAVNQAVLRSCREAGFSPLRAQEAPDTAVLLALVAAGLGIALVPASARALALDGVAFREVGGAGSIEIALAWRAEDDDPASGSPLVRSVLAALRAGGVVPPPPRPRRVREVHR